MVNRRMRKYVVTLYKDAVISSRTVVTYVGYKGMSSSKDAIPIVKTASDVATVEVELPSNIKPSIDAFETPSLSPYLRTLLNDGYRTIGWSEIK